MSLAEQKKHITLENVSMVKQIEGIGKTIDAVQLILDLSDVIDRNAAKRFMIQVNLQHGESSYTVSSTHNMTEVSEEGILSLGTGYILGPIDPNKITYTAVIRYLYD